MSKWETVRLGDVATYINGFAFKPSDWSDSGLPIIRIQNLTGNDYETNYYDKDYSEKFLVKNGDVLISWSASLGVYEWKGENALLNQHIFKVVFDKLDVDKKYFINAVSYLLDEMSRNVHGSTMKHITKPAFDKTPFPLPPLEIQREIAYNLDKAAEAVGLCRKILEKLDFLVKAKFTEMFGDPETGEIRYPQKDLASLSTKISDGVHAKPNYTPTGKPFLSVVNINKGEVDFTNCKFVSEEAYRQMIKSTHPEKGDVLYTKVGNTYGISAHVDTDEDFCLYVSVCLIKPKHDLINSKFLAIQMGMPFIKHQADKRIKGIGVPDLHLNQISQFQILYPPRELQDKFVDYVYKIDLAKSAVKKSLEKAETLRAALMQKYFG